MQISIFLRHPIQGQNSIEVLTNEIARGLLGAEKYVLPYYANNLKGIIRNITFIIKNKGNISYFAQPSGAYATPFLKKSIVVYHDLFTLYDGKSKFNKFVTRILYVLIPEIFATKLVCISNITKEELVNNLFFKKHKNKISVIYNGIRDGCVFSHKNYDTKNPSVLHIGTAPRKNLETVIKALDGTKFRLNIVGKLSEKQIFLLRTSRLKYSNCFDVSNEEINQLYKESDIVSFPTLAEGFGMIPIEANCIGRPVITSSIPIMMDIAADGAYHLRNPIDEKEMRSAFFLIDGDKDFREDLISRGRRNSERFTYEKMITEYKNLLESILQRK